jgi:hypothetical protein
MEKRRCAAWHSGRDRKFPNKNTAVLKPVGVSDGDAGKRPSSRATPIIARTRPGPNACGRKAIAIIGARIGLGTRSTAWTTASVPGGANVSAGGALRSLQRTLLAPARSVGQFF